MLEGENASKAYPQSAPHPPPLGDLSRLFFSGAAPGGAWVSLLRWLCQSPTLHCNQVPSQQWLGRFR